MIDVVANRKMNERLSELYIEYGPQYLEKYVEVFKDSSPPQRINEFGIIDETRYDRDKGILVVAKETDGWSNEDYANEWLFRAWMLKNTREGLKGHARQHPVMWYNVARWISYISNQEQNIQNLAAQCSIDQIGTIAYTNMNKVRGGTHSGKEYYELANARVSGEILQRELDIIQPKIILCCGTYEVFLQHQLCHEAVVIDMPHPGARKCKIGMLEKLRKELAEKLRLI